MPTRVSSVPSSRARSTRRLLPETRPEAIREILEGARAKGLTVSGHGALSGHVPGLDQIPPERFAISVALLDGTVVSVGDHCVDFSIQSIAKLFSLAALLRVSPGSWDSVGWEATEEGFRSLRELEQRQGRPRNPFVNAGALVVTDQLISFYGDGAGPALELLREQSGNSRIRSSAKIARAEAERSHVNNAIAHILTDTGRLSNPIGVVLRSYFRQCAIEASTEDLARAALFLSVRSREGKVLTAEGRRRFNAVLLTAGMYNAAGDIAYRVGLPAKSGIGGGIVGVLPSVGTICVWSPPLDPQGNSVGGIAALEEFSRAAGWSIF